MERDALLAHGAAYLLHDRRAPLLFFTCHVPWAPQPACALPLVRLPAARPARAPLYISFVTCPELRRPPCALPHACCPRLASSHMCSPCMLPPPCQLPHVFHVLWPHSKALQARYSASQAQLHSLLVVTFRCCWPLWPPEAGLVAVPARQCGICCGCMRHSMLPG
jgi:hypothetical protein